MTRCKLRAIRQLRELHELYGKHDYRLAAQFQWLGDEEKIYACPCGLFAHEDDLDNKGNIVPVTATVYGGWIESAFWALKKQDRGAFRDYLRRINWEPTTRQNCILVYGSKGRGMWRRMYGNALTKAGYYGLQEDKK